MSNGFQRAKSLREAKQLFKQCIDELDFEAARSYKKQIDEYQVFDQTKNKSDVVADYLYKKEDIDDKVQYDVEKYKYEIENAKSQLIRGYQERFINLRKECRIELDDWMEKWAKQRNKIQSDMEQQYKATMVTARLVAENNDFDKAIEIQNKAKTHLEDPNKKEFDPVDNNFSKNITQILQRQNSVFKEMSVKRDVEIKILNELLHAVKAQAVDIFMKDNAEALDKILRKIPNPVPLPLALKHQYVKAVPGQNQHTIKTSNFYK